jgi:hypothetical protein
MPRFQMYVNSDVNVLSFKGNFLLLHIGTVLNLLFDSCLLALAKIQTNYYRTNFFLLFLSFLGVAPFIVMMAVRVLGA